MRKSFVALLLIGAAALLTNAAFAQDLQSDPGNKLLNAKSAKERLSRASRLGVSATQPGDTLFVGHTPAAWNSVTNPWAIQANHGDPNTPATAGYRPSVNNLSNWDFDSFNAGETDSLQGWWPARALYTITGGLTLPDKSRPWWAIEHGNQANYVLNSRHQNRTTGVIGVWHVDGGSSAPGPNPSASPSWAPLAGTGSAWAGLRAHGDNTVADAITGNPFNQDVLNWNGINAAAGGGTVKNFPGYGSQWDQILYRDVRVKDGSNLTISFKYRTKQSTSADLNSATRTGWFDKDPTAVTVGNFISSSDAGANAPVDSFSVYIGVPANPTAARHADGNVVSVYDLRRRWFSEVIAIDQPYSEILSVAGDANTTFGPALVGNAVIQPMLNATNAAESGPDGIIRIAFRAHSNRGFDDEGSAYNSGTEGQVRVDDVSVTASVAGSGSIVSGFEAAGEINNAIEGPNSGTPGPAVGQGYAVSTWKSTGKPPAIYFHTHPIFGGDIGGSNFYAPLAYNELCGAPLSSARVCNIGTVVISAGDHDHGEKAGGALNTTEQETMDGMFSPTVNLVISGGSNNVLGTGTNGIGISDAYANPADDYYVFYDMYAGIFNLFFTGNAWRFGSQTYPATQLNGQKVWGTVQVPGFQFFNPDPQCFTDFEALYGNGLVLTSNTSGIADSIRLYMGKNQQCFRFAVSLGCSPSGGCYFDNLSLALSNGGTAQHASSVSALGSITANIWDFWNDAFPRNETPGLPGTAAFDTAAALLQTGINNAANTGTVSRPDVPGDSAAVTATGANMQVHMVFRIKPGPGNYVTAGVVGSGLRKVPQNAAAASPGDGSFWGEYMLKPGEGAGTDFAKGNHAGGWNVNTWNAARIDSTEARIFPVYAKNVGRPNAAGLWGATYHESSNKYNSLGILKNLCFLTDTAGATNSTNIQCNGVAPAWVTTVPASRTGWDGSTQTIELTKIIPDGLLTPGSHVEYFFRKSDLSDPATFVAVPDTEFIFPQNGEGPSTDRHRWQEFSVLPDAWKFPQYPGGLAGACMLYVDLNDRRGNEGAFIGVADSIGLNKSTHYGAHNGWHAVGGTVYTNLQVGGDPSIAVWDHKGQAGTAFDMYGVKASESLTTSGGSLGARLATPGAGFMAGKDSKVGPTPEMLRTYYRQLLLLTGDLNSGILGPFVNRSQDDVTLLQDFMANTSGSATPRGVWAMGDGFAQSEILTGGVVASHTTLITTYFATQLRDGSYQSVSGNLNSVADLLTTNIISPPSGGTPPTAGGDVFGVQNSCTWSNDLLNVNTAISGAAAASFYQSAGFTANAPYVASVYAPNSGTRPWISLLDGWDIEHLHSRFDANSYGRLAYFMDVLAHVFPGQCANWGSPNVDVPNLSSKQVINYMNLRNNPLRSGLAVVNLSLAKSDHVQVDVYDVSGRHVKNLFNGFHQAGEFKLSWDGTSDNGTPLPRGVFFTQVKYLNSRFVDSKKLTILK